MKKAGVFAVILAVVLLLGAAVGALIKESADDNDSWVSTPQRGNNCASTSPAETIPEPKSELTVSGLPTTIETDFGYGRGTRVIDGTVFSVSPAPNDAELPSRLAVVLLPLQHGTDRAITSTAAQAERLGTTSNYRLRLCIDAPKVRGGTYEAKLLFTSEQVITESTPAVVARFQNQLVPYVLTMFVPIAVPLGILYMAAVLIRRAKPDIDLSTGWTKIREAFWSINGAFAIIAAAGAAFGAWQASCNANTTWGQDWSEVPLTLVAVVGAAAGAATVPLGLSRNSVDDPEGSDEAGPASPPGRNP